MTAATFVVDHGVPTEPGHHRPEPAVSLVDPNSSIAIGRNNTVVEQGFVSRVVVAGKTI
jgi:hypothetical protein